MLVTAVTGSKSLHPTKKSEEPLSKIKSNGAFGGKVEVSDVTFKKFADVTRCGREQFVLERNPTSADYIPMHTFERTTFESVADSALAEIEKPNPDWATTSPIETAENCGNITCTGPENVVLSFKNTVASTELGEFSLSSSQETAFQITSRNTDLLSGVGTCTDHPDQLSYRCENTALGILIFESLDPDNEDRDLQPVYMIDENNNINKINSFMDHSWNGFYTSQKRLQRFPGLVQAGTNVTVQMNGTPPKDMRFALKAGANEGGMKVLIPFVGPVAFSVYAAEGGGELEKVTANPF